MKKFTVLLLMIINLSVTVFALPVNECKADIYFGNGVWNTSKQAQASADILNGVIHREIIKHNSTLAAKYGTVKLQYNWGQG